VPLVSAMSKMLPSCEITRQNESHSARTPLLS
jgi:hypothetical protein